MDENIIGQAQAVGIFFIQSSIIKFHCYFQKGGKREKRNERKKGRERERKRRQPELHSNKQKNGSLRNEWWWENNRLMEKNKIGEYMK